MTETRNAGGPQHLLRSQLTAEEVAVMQECGRESFYYRSLPLAGASVLATHALIQSGHIKVGRFGGAPKYIAAATVGYFVGKLSYVSVVRERVLALPNSRLADMLRARGGGSRGGGEAALYGAEAGLADAEVGLAPLDSRQTEPVTGLDDIYRPTLDSVSPVDGHQLGTDDLPAAQSATSYQRLRQLNRAEYEGAARADNRSRQQPPPPVQRPSPAGPPVRTNKYGDAWE